MDIISNQDEQDRLLASYNDLPPFVKVVLQLCSVIYEPVDAASLIKCLYQCNIQSSVGKPDYARQMQQGLDLLKSKNLLLPRMQCPPLIVEIISRQAVSDGHFPKMAQAVREEMPLSANITTSGLKAGRATRELRIDLYNGDIENFHQHLISFYQNVTNIHRHPIVTICNNPFSPEWMAAWPDHLQFLALHEILKDSISRLAPIGPQLHYLAKGLPEHGPPPINRHPSFLYLYISSLIFRGELQKAKKLATERAEELKSFGLQGWLDFIYGRNDEALQEFQNDLQSLRKMDSNDVAYFTGFEGLLCFLAQLSVETPESGQRLHNICHHIKSIQAGNQFQLSYRMLKAVMDYKMENRAGTRIELPSYDFELSSVDSLFTALAGYWIEGKLDPTLLETIAANFELARENGYQWLAREFAEILSQMTGEDRYEKIIRGAQQQLGTAPLLTAISHEEPWRRALNKLKLVAAGQPAEPGTSRSRVIWLIRINETDNSIEEIIPKEQLLTTKGGWSKGRTLSLKKLRLARNRLLSEQDEKICAALRSSRDLYGGIICDFDSEQTVQALIGHPLVFDADNQDQQIDIIKKEPELHVHNQGRTISVHLSPFPRENKEIYLRLETPARLNVYQMSATHHRIAEIVGPYGLRLPEQSKDELLKLVSGISTHLNVHSDYDAPAQRLKTIEADNKIYCHIIPSGPGFRVSLQIKPFGPSGPRYIPGCGSRVIIAEIQGIRTQALRDLAGEEQAARQVENSCPIFNNYEDHQREWIFPDLHDCLELLLQLRKLSETVVVEWPKGKKLHLSARSGSRQLYLQIKKRREWFEIDGKLQISDKDVIEIEQLLDLVSASESRFIPLSDRRFLTLTRELYQHLTAINDMAVRDKGAIQLSRINAPLMLDFTREVKELQVDSHWQKLEKMISETEEFTPKIPSTLSAELRSYQVEGFNWLARLARLGFGACLADEMGLGKTVQALAIILDQATKGPSLVITPTSVCLNWQDEAARFIPTVRTTLFGGAERKEMIRKLKNFDLLITSYGMLQQEHELLAEQQWQVIVLDEAQAIKNMGTKRSRAAMQLKARFKLITTGTPLENNLGELWNLFRFINPGLLGTISQFNKRFAAPIEKEEKLPARKRLKKLIKPFILRRLKSQVLDELPPRTEINLQVDLDREELALYESMRRQAIKTVEADKRQPFQRPIRILAEIMKLRRMCCHPDLVAPDLKLKSSKLTLFSQLIDELMINRHKVLVFSQFVDLLTIIRNFLDKKGINYQYLDGGTPIRQRKIRVDAFQAGKGDIFLISLKAGGLGLNLTAANYVIHMDPWWNPAVEDQASDRVHRIGQKLPVTVYRLITKSTIEEKIVALHRRKRQLANTLLEGTGSSGKISAEELLQLLKE